MHIESVPNRKSHPTILLRESYRADGKVRKRTIANLTHWPEQLVEGLRTLLRGGVAVARAEEALTIARSLMGNPRLLLLDEPSEGLAPKVVENVRDQVKLLKESGLTIILAEQNLSFILHLSDRVHILEKGEVKWSGTADDLKSDKSIIERYLTV